jgi:hypothetical protein
MEVIGVTSGRPPSVDRVDGSTSVILTIDGLREAKVRDKRHASGSRFGGNRLLVCGDCSASG